MKKVLLLLVLILSTATVARAEFLNGIIYNGSTTPGGGYTPISAAKVGTAKCTSVFLLVGTGDCSVRTAMKNGRIRQLGGYDVERKNILGFQQITVRAWGN